MQKIRTSASKSGCDTQSGGQSVDTQSKLMPQIDAFFCHKLHSWSAKNPNPD